MRDGQQRAPGRQMRDHIWACAYEIQRNSGVPAASKEVAVRLGISRQLLAYHVRRLERAGLVRFLYGGHAIYAVSSPPPSFVK